MINPCENNGFISSLLSGPSVYIKSLPLLSKQTYLKLKHSLMLKRKPYKSTHYVEKVLMKKFQKLKWCRKESMEHYCKFIHSCF